MATNNRSKHFPRTTTWYETLRFNTLGPMKEGWVAIRRVSLLPLDYWSLAIHQPQHQPAISSESKFLVKSNVSNILFLGCCNFWHSFYSQNDATNNAMIANSVPIAIGSITSIFTKYGVKKNNIWFNKFHFNWSLYFDWYVSTSDNAMKLDIGRQQYMDNF